MKSSNDKYDVQREYQAFSEGEPAAAPAVLESTLRRVARDLNPTFGQALSKLFGLHALALAVTLTVCPQFGLGPIGGGHGVMHVVMRYGEVACAVFCAAFLFGTTLLLARLFLTRHEMRAVGNRALVAGSSVAGLSFAFFMLLDALTVSVVVNLTTGIIWAIAGAAILASLRFFHAHRAPA